MNGAEWSAGFDRGGPRRASLFASMPSRTRPSEGLPAMFQKNPQHEGFKVCAGTMRQAQSFHLRSLLTLLGEKLSRVELPLSQVSCHACILPLTS
jgi:hypothetical protein